VAHEPSSASCSLLSCGLIETAELMDEDAFLEAMEASDCIVVIWVVVI
jgi:sulfur relay (sulfurtransferase) DsrF/TusC family protein